MGRWPVSSDHELSGGHAPGTHRYIADAPGYRRFRFSRFPSRRIAATVGMIFIPAITDVAALIAIRISTTHPAKPWVQARPAKRARAKAAGRGQ